MPKIFDLCVGCKFQNKIWTENPCCDCNDDYDKFTTKSKPMKIEQPEKFYKGLMTRRGVITVSSEALYNPEKFNLQLLYSKFFPIAIDNDNSSFGRNMKIYCYSEYFREVPEAEIPPHYEVTFRRLQVTEDTFETVIEKVTEVK